MEGLFEFLYPTVIVTGNLAFLPQIRKLYRDTGKAEGMSLEAWLLWFVNSIISLGYASFCVMDVKFAMASGIAVMLNAVVCSLIIYHRYIKVEKPTIFEAAE